MATEALVPDLLAAARAAQASRERHQYSAAFHLVPQTLTLPSGRQHVQAVPERAVEHAWAVVADRYEMAALIAAAEGGESR